MTFMLKFSLIVIPLIFMFSWPATAMVIPRPFNVFKVPMVTLLKCPLLLPKPLIRLSPLNSISNPFLLMFALASVTISIGLSPLWILLPGLLMLVLRCRSLLTTIWQRP